MIKLVPLLCLGIQAQEAESFPRYGGSFDIATPEARIFSQPNGTEPFYNILAIDGGGIRGLIPLGVTNYME